MAFSIPFVFIFSFTKKPVNKTVKDSHNKMISQQDIKLENTKRCFYSILHKKTDLKSARQDLQGKGNICLLFLGTSTSLKQASEWNSSLFFMIPVLKSLSKKKKRKENYIRQMSSRAFPVQPTVFNYVLFFLFSSSQVLVWEYTDCSPDIQVLYGNNELLYSTLLPMGPVPENGRIIITLSSQQHLL